MPLGSPAAQPRGSLAAAPAAGGPPPAPWLWAPAALVLCLGLLLLARARGRAASATKRRHARAARGCRGPPRAARRQPQGAAQHQPRGPSRDIQLRVACQGTGQEARLSIDSLATGEALLQRARGCLGQGLAGLRLPCGGALAGARSLAAQGLRSGDLVCGVVEGGDAVASAGAAGPARQRLTLERFSFDQHASQVSDEHHRLDVTINARQEPAALAVATSESVSCEFTEHGFTLTVRGPSTDYVLRRKMESRGGLTRDNILSACFDLCPARCTVKVTPRQCIQISLRPTPDDWLPGGARVRVQGLKESAELNGLAGVVEGYEEYAGKFQPARYVVRVDGSGEPKRIQRKNLVPEDAPRAGGGGEAGALGAPGPRRPQAREGPAEARAPRADVGGGPRPRAPGGRAAAEAATPLQVAAASDAGAASVLRGAAGGRHAADVAAGMAGQAALTESAPVAQMVNCQRLGSVEKGASALHQNIASKGSNAYYFAHDRAYEVPAHAKVITGPGLVAGGAPQKLSGPEGVRSATWSCEEL